MIEDVHTSHCCKWHGCKYNDIDCTVELGLGDQEYPCEICSYDWEDYKRFLNIDPPWIRFMEERNA